MLVEGLYLYMLVVKTFSGDNIRFNIYASIGWGKCFSSAPWVIKLSSTNIQFYYPAAFCFLFSFWPGGPALFVVTWAVAKGLTVNYNSNVEKVSGGLHFWIGLGSSLNFYSRPVRHQLSLDGGDER